MNGMVEIRAIVRIEMLDRVVRMVKDSGCPRLTVTRVHAIGAGVDPKSPKYGFEEGSAYVDKAMVQFICSGERCEMFSELFVRAARTGNRGDGIVSIHPVYNVTKIRTGVDGLAALE
jgi:nitrogen regulatory protein PII